MNLTKMVLLSLILILPFNVYAAENLRKITVTGKSEVVVEAHHAIIQLNVKYVKKEMRQSYNELIRVLSKLAKDLKHIGIPDTDIKKSLILQGQERSWENNSNILKGYFSECLIELDIKDINKLDEVYKALANYRSVTIQGTDYQRNDEFDLRKAEFNKALQTAKKKAEYMAQALNAKIGKVHSIQELNSENPIAVNTYTNLRDKEFNESKPRYGNIRITALAVVEFDLE